MSYKEIQDMLDGLRLRSGDQNPIILHENIPKHEDLKTGRNIAFCTTLEIQKLEGRMKALLSGDVFMTVINGETCTAINSDLISMDDIGQYNFTITCLYNHILSFAPVFQERKFEFQVFEDMFFASQKTRIENKKNKIMITNDNLSSHRAQIRLCKKQIKETEELIARESASLERGYIMDVDFLQTSIGHLAIHMFDEVYTNGRGLNCITKEIHLPRQVFVDGEYKVEMFSVGSFRITLHQNWVSELSVTIGEHERNRYYRDFYHPHVNDEGEMCWGENLDEFQTACRDMDILFILNTANATLNSYNADDAYYLLEDF